MHQLREVIRTASRPSTWSKDGKVAPSVRERIDLMNSIVWMDLEIGATYLKLQQIMEVTCGIHLDNVNESFFSITDEEMESAKDDADDLIEMCVLMGIKIEEAKTCRDGKVRTYRRNPTYGDIVTLPREWVIRYLSRDAEPEEHRPDRHAVSHKYDDRWWTDDRENELGFEPDPVLDTITFKDVWEDRAQEVAERVERGLSRTKCQAVLDIMLDHAAQGEWDWKGRDIVAKRVYFTDEFRKYCRNKLMADPSIQKEPSYKDVTNYCWITIKSLVSQSYVQRTWANEKFRRLHDWALAQMKATKELTRLEELERVLRYKPARRAGELDPDQRMVAEN